ncbi:Alpha/Beta hydrolase protein [Mycena rebaudengoi]|nr:Alpha/Beta hydrolase protein [Mycena rebaudengoi]
MIHPFLLSIVLSSAAFAAHPTVSLKYATFRGIADGNLTNFLGVPYAQPAVRFQAPKPPIQLRGVQDATHFGSTCPQQALDPIPAPFVFGNYTISEDCLTLNVFKPASAANSKLPVFFWIFGGGFEIGSSSDTDVRSVVERSIVLDEPVIIVTPNYRLSAFGFLAGNQVKSAGITNLGLRDQITALEWVREHISTFGGDPDRVVIGGPSSGAISTSILMLSNKLNTNMLFRGAFMLSGAPISTDSVADGQADYDQLVAVNNCTGSLDTLGCLRRVPFESFMATVNKTTNIFSFSSMSNIWHPRVDGEVIVRNPLISVSEGLHSKIPIMMGNSDDEGTVFSFGNDNITTNAEFLTYIQSNYLPHSTPAQIARVGDLYPEDPAQGSPFDTGSQNALTPEFKRLAAFQGDLKFLGPRRSFLQHVSARQDAWSWLNKRGKSTPVVGAFHGSDTPIWFPTNNMTQTIGVDALINFINTLNPNRSAARGSKHSPSIFWPKWNTRSANGSTSLLTFSEPDRVDITADDFRAEAIGFLNGLAFEAAEHQ